MDTIDSKFDDFMKEFKRIDDTKRTEAAILRKRNAELEEYKKEKRREIPSKVLPYSKFKPDLLSWDKENHLSSGSVKFGLLAEMLKKQDRIITYEQIQTRLGKNRNDPNIIKQTIELLDEINEETVFNKMNSAWNDISKFKKDKADTLNEFFSKFETLHYSLKHTDDSYEELEPVQAGKDLKYYQEREKMIHRKVELNDKLKAIQLLQALALDDGHERDILSKINFNKEPKQVFEETKIAVRDIVGDKYFANNEKETEVHIVKPWQGNQEDEHKRRGDRYLRGRSRERLYRNGKFEQGRDSSRRRYSRERSRDGYYRDRSKEGYSRQRSQSEGRSGSRGRDRRRSSVSFMNKRDSTPGAGMEDVFY